MWCTLGAGSEHPPFEGTLQGVLKGSSGGRTAEGLKAWSPPNPLKASFKPPSSPLRASFKPPSSPLRAPFKPPWSPLHLEAPLKVPTLKPPSSPLQAPFKPPSCPLQAPFKPPSAPLQAPFKPPSCPLQASFTLKPPWTPLENQRPVAGSGLRTDESLHLQSGTQTQSHPTR